MSKYVGAVDQGTTSTRFMIFDHSGGVVGVHQMEHKQIYPQPGWVEHDPLEIWARAPGCDQGRRWRRPASTPRTWPPSASPTSARPRSSGTRSTGKPYYNAIVWQDTRTDKICNELAKDGGQDRFRAKVGLPLATYFSGPKVTLDPRQRARRPRGSRAAARPSSATSTPGSSGT